MPLSPPPERELLHSRDIVLRGYLRVDGLYDIEAHLTDTKTYGSANRDRGYIHAGEPIHGMWIRLTVDEQRRIVACELIAAAQGVEFHRPLKAGAGVERALARVRSGVKPLTADRAQTGDIEHTAAMLASEDLA